MNCSKLYRAVFTLAALTLAAASAHSQIKIGVVLSTTGPAASLGIPEQKTVELFPKQIGGEAVQYIILDDASDPTGAVKATKKLVTEDGVHAVIGSTTTPSSLAMRDTLADAGVPQISVAAGRSIVYPMDDKRRWVFNTAPSTALMANAIARHMKEQGVKKAAYIGFDDAFGEDWSVNFAESAKANGIELVASERYSRAATSVTGQTLHIKAAKPDAVMIGASGTAAALPERSFNQIGYKGKLYQSGGVANPDFLRICGADCNGTIVAAAPGLVAPQLPENASFKAAAMRFADTYQAAHGPKTLTQFGANAWDSGVLLEQAIPVALKSAKPSDRKAFSAALRDALEGLKNVPAAGGVYTMTATDHNGLDEQGVVLVEIVNGDWKLMK
ncbi:ABC transporter substrate-binding protein [Comamonas sp. NLF-1-9]|uniref:ABC transporter substrate-binding protein n=1 Tax=Comamonas sp. NLF-1-9 TaxID=2853163 RepID=UPI001C458040|nr:ABC transporter substrate-binding protein [Comamonas sp. NLF-1-9]QXL83357.1 ABC transporter substrate-binding protein [Comamonas sp. NLF-1-9]